MAVLNLAPAQAFRFFVEIEGVYVGQFVDCSGLNVEREVRTLEEGGVNDHVHVFGGRVKYSNVTLKRGITYEPDLWDWFHEGLHTLKIRRRPVSIVLGNAEGKRVKHWDLTGAYPVKWSGASLNTETMQVAYESVELAHHGIVINSDETKPLGSGWKDA